MDKPTPPAPPVRPRIDRPTPANPPKAASPAHVPTQAFATCSSDDLTMVRLPARRQDDPAYRKHGIRPASAWFPTTASKSSSNQAIAYLYGRCLFEDIANAISTAFSAEHRIYLIGWSTDKGLKLKVGGDTLEDYLMNTRAQVRAMLYDGNITLTPLLKVAVGVPNKWIDTAINQMNHGASLLDGRLPPTGIHHQKLLVVQGQFGLVAFIGGMDFDPSRVEIKPKDGRPWHDVHLRLAGPAALECRKVFEDRWLDHPATHALDRMLGLPPTATIAKRVEFAFPAPAALSLGDLPSVTMVHGSKREVRKVRVSVGRTFGKERQSSSAAKPVYAFAPSGDYSAWALIEHGIKQAVRWIYVEDQYMVSRMARNALLAKFKEDKFEYLLILMTGSGGVAKEFKYIVTARNEFRRDLLAEDPSRRRWGMYTLKTPLDSERQKWCGGFVHSKTWIFDDGYAVVGSANCDNRGYTLDSEIVAGIAEENDLHTFLGESFAIDLRTRLWHKHLGVPHAQVRDFEKGLNFWKKPPPSAMITEYSSYELDNELSPPAHFPSAAEASSIEYAWKNLIDPDAR